MPKKKKRFKVKDVERSVLKINSEEISNRRRGGR